MSDEVKNEAEKVPEPGASNSDAPKRKRGRPSNAELAARAAGGSPAAVKKDGAPKRKRGRPAKEDEKPRPMFRLAAGDVPADMLAAASDLPPMLANVLAKRISKGKFVLCYPPELIELNRKAFAQMVDGFDIQVEPWKAYLIGTAATIISGAVIGGIALASSADPVAIQKAMNEASAQMRTVATPTPPAAVPAAPAPVNANGELPRVPQETEQFPNADSSSIPGSGQPASA